MVERVLLDDEEMEENFISEIYKGVTDLDRTFIDPATHLIAPNLWLEGGILSKVIGL